MSAISDFAASVKASFESISSDVDTVVASNTEITTAVAGVSADVKQLKDTIDKLQNSPGTITPEDQALLDSAQSQASSAASKLKSASDALKAQADALKALDESTAPSEAPTPPTP